MEQPARYIYSAANFFLNRAGAVMSGGGEVILPSDFDFNLSGTSVSKSLMNGEHLECVKSMEIQSLLQVCRDL